MSVSPVAAIGPVAIALVGEIDCASADAAGEEVRAGLAAGARVVDLSDLTFIDVAGMRALAHAIRAHGDTVILQQASELMQRCWHVAGFHKVAPTAIFVS